MYIVAAVLEIGGTTMKVTITSYNSALAIHASSALVHVCVATACHINWRMHVAIVSWQYIFSLIVPSSMMTIARIFCSGLRESRVYNWIVARVCIHEPVCIYPPYIHNLPASQTVLLAMVLECQLVSREPEAHCSHCTIYTAYVSMVLEEFLGVIHIPQ